MCIYFVVAKQLPFDILDKKNTNEVYTQQRLLQNKKLNRLQRNVRSAATKHCVVIPKTKMLCLSMTLIRIENIQRRKKFKEVKRAAATAPYNTYTTTH